MPPSNAHDQDNERDGIHQCRQRPRFAESTINIINNNNNKLAQFLYI